MSAAVGLSLFPSAREVPDGQGRSNNVPALTSRQSMMNFKRSSWLAKHVNSGNSESQADRFESVSPQSSAPERPYSPNSFLQRSEQSSSPTLVASSRNSMSTLKSRKKPPPATIDTQGSSEIRSIFPTYDTNLPLEDQWYLPTQTSPRNIPWEQVCKGPYSPDFEMQHTKPADDSDAPKPLLFTAPQDVKSDFSPEIQLPSLWELSQGRANSEARAQTYRLQMHRCEPLLKKSKPPKGKASNLQPLLTFGPSTSHPFFSVFSEPCSLEKEKGTEKKFDRIRVRKHNLARFDSNRDYYGESSILVSDMTMQVSDDESTARAGDDSDAGVATGIAHVTPHKAILDSLSMAGTSTEAAELATVDPAASSIAAAHLAEVAMSKAKKMNTSHLTFSTVPALRQRGYALQHPSLGYFQIQVEGDVQLPRNSSVGSSTNPAEDNKPPVLKPGSIKLLAPVYEKIPPMYGVSTGSHHAFKNPCTVLASIDLPSSTLTLDGAALTNVNDRYMVDTAVSVLISVLLAETACPRLSNLTNFAPPPTLAMYKASLKGTPKYKYFPLIKTRKEAKVRRVDKAAAEMEQSMTMALGALVFVLETAVDGLHNMAERAKSNNATYGDRSASSVFR